MSTRKTIYVMLCESVPVFKADGFYDTYASLMEMKVGKNCILYDGMCGQYAYFGRVLAASEEDSEDALLYEQDPEELRAILQEVKDAFWNVFALVPSLKGPRLRVIQHWH